MTDDATVMRLEQVPRLSDDYSEAMRRFRQAGAVETVAQPSQDAAGGFEQVFIREQAFFLAVKFPLDEEFVVAVNFRTARRIR